MSWLWDWIPWRIVNAKRFVNLLEDWKDMRAQNWQMVLSATEMRARLEKLDAIEAAQVKRRARVAAKVR